ncbi:hypothetical protein [Paraliomyxa miuraensis]|uniref:hypothetical protein n=1 Tax=Paraliomyxa miuraensis TaxID=376150 RepID=UPI002253BE42|nr:hypothetical protein [Paraliomyxa miuraensis]MCX4239538.1 hypothetical protein [Paraliomyxa miuraensis]
MTRWMLSMLLVGAACSGSVEEDATEGTGIDLSAGGSESPRLDQGSPGQFPDLGPVVLADPPPPPVSGGTLLRSHDGATLFAADPDRDAVYVVDPAAQRLIHAVELEPGTEPGRIAEDPSGLIHVALRRSGEVATIDIASGELVAVRSACANPRGLAVDPGDGSVLVACAEGVLARLRPDDSLEQLAVGIELRDVIDPGPPIRVSTFRDAQVLTLDDTGTIRARQAPPEIGVFIDLFIDPDDPDAAEVEPHDVMTPNTARRTWSTADGGWLMLHQAGSGFARNSMVTDGYAGGDGFCIPLQATVITHGLPGGASAKAWPFHHIAPAFDADVTDELDMAAVVGGTLGEWVIMFATHEQPRTVVSPPCRAEHSVVLPGEPTSVVFDDEGHAWVQLREPAALVRVDPQEEALVANIGLAERSVLDTGHDLFHRPTPGMVACVSCHPEGREDGRVWQFSDLGPRRTQALDTGLEGTEPFHWRGELADMAGIVDDTYESRMGGPDLDEEHVAALERWLFALPSLRVVTPQDTAIERGRERFEAVGCTSCHLGPKLTHNGTVVLGPHGLLQVPSLLNVAFRAPYMHDGRAIDLEAAVDDMLRLTAPSVDVSAEGRAELVAYLASLGAE